MAIKQDILAWDGKSFEMIQTIYDNYSQDPGFVKTILRLMAEERSQRGSSWLLKTYLSKGGLIGQAETTMLFQLLAQLSHWETRLHILQSLSFIQIPKEYKEELVAFFRQCLDEDNKFIRAWSYNGFWLLSRQYPQYQQETQNLFSIAMREESPAVKARIRRILAGKD